MYDRLRLHSLMVVPLRARGRVLGALTLLSQHPYGRRFSQRDLHLATDIAGRAALAVDNARLYETEHAAAATLQHSLLPAVPSVPGLQIAARYLVGMDGNQVGGDWYDVLNLPDGAVGVAVGDVVGHDLRAAAAMGQLRGVLRSYAWDGGPPGSVLDRCDQLVQGLDMAAMATAVYARLEPPDATGERVLRYANAGHPTPLLLGPDGKLWRLDGNHSPMIGAVPSLGRRDGPGRTEATVRCALGIGAGALHRRPDRRRRGGCGPSHGAAGTHRRRAAAGRVRPDGGRGSRSGCAPRPAAATTWPCWPSGSPPECSRRFT